MPALPLLDLPATPVQPATLPAVEAGNLYVHVPFCAHKCHYCDFYSITRQDEGRMERFVDLLLREAALWTSGEGPRPRPRTIFFGGGTPSLLPHDTMRRLLVGLRETFDLSQLNEWTIEVNPATADETYLAMLRESGINRLSFGAQSFDRRDLHLLERHHDPDDVPAAVAMARRAGFERLSVDLIYAIPGQTLEAWDATLRAALSLGTEHLSCYGLTYEPNTPLAVRKRLGRVVAAEEDLELAMLRHTRRVCSEEGRPAYEISNYARLGAACRHNLACWSGDNYLALGPSGASHVAGHRFRNAPHLGKWENGIAAGLLPTIDVEQLTHDERLRERVFLGLRLTAGVDLDALAAEFKVDVDAAFSEVLPRLRDLGLVEVVERRLRLTQAGLAVADAVAAEFLA